MTTAADVINGELLKINQWLVANKLSLNVSKLNLMQRRVPFLTTNLVHTKSFLIHKDHIKKNVIDGYNDH